MVVNCAGLEQGSVLAADVQSDLATLVFATAEQADRIVGTLAFAAHVRMCSVRSCVGCAAIAAGLTWGCGSDDGLLVETTAGSLSSTTECASGVFATDHHRFKYIGVSVTRHLCRPAGLELPTFITTDDASGKAVDFVALEAADRYAFHAWHGSMEPDFRNELENAPAQPVEAYVWFQVDGSDAAGKEWLVGDAVAAAQAEVARENKIRGGAKQLKLKLDQVEGIEVITDVATPKEYGIPVLRVRSTLAALDAVGGWEEVWRIDPLPPEPTPASDTYYYTTLETVLDGAYGYDGTGIIVAQFEGGYPDSWQQLTGARVGNCQDVWNTWRECHCPAGAYTFHSRLTAGIYRRSSGILGMSNAATTIAANHGGNCTTNGPDNYASALNWATSQGARVIGHS